MDETMSGVQFANNSSVYQNPIAVSPPGLNIDLVVQLIHTLYDSKNPDEQKEADRRLTELQNSNEAWDICWVLLDPSHEYSGTVHFFAANLLALKIGRNWSQQDSTWLESQLRPKLFDLLIKHSSCNQGTRQVIERLALALANFALHSIPTFWPDAIEDILCTFTGPDLPSNIYRNKVFSILIKILIFLPEEYSVMLPQLDHRARLNERIAKSAPIVFKFLHSLLNDQDLMSNNSDGMQDVFKCLTSWTLNSQSTLLEMEDGLTLLNRLYDLIWDEDFCASACSTLGASFASPKAENFRNSIIQFIPKIAALQAAIQKYKNEDDIECVIKIYSLVINFSENHSKLLLKIVLEDGINLEGPRAAEIKQAVFGIINIILECTAAPGIFDLDEKYSDTAFPFWFSFFEDFCYYDNGYNDRLCQLFDPLVNSLISVLIKKAQYPPTVTFHQIWDEDKRDSYRRYRQDLADSVSLIVTFPRARDRILAQLLGQFDTELSTMLQAKPSPGEERPWQRTEAVIFTIKSVSEIIPYDESKFVPKIFELLAKIPYNESHADLYCTVAEMVAAYSDWLYTHPEHLSIAFTVLFLGVASQNSHVRLMSTLSLKDMTTECQSVLQPYAPQIIKSCGETLVQHGHILTISEKCRLMHTIGTSLAVSNASEIESSLRTLTLPIVCDLSSNAQLDPASDETCRSAILDRLAMLNSLLESLYIKPFNGNEYEDCDENDPRLLDMSGFLRAPEGQVVQPAIGLLRELMPIMTVIAQKYRTDEDVMDRMTDTLRRSAKSLGVELQPIVPDMITLVVNAYDPIFNSFIVDGLVAFYRMFKSEEALRDMLRDALARISDKTIEVCLANHFRQLSLTVQNYFDFVTPVFKKIPDFLTELPTPIRLDYIYRLALASLTLPEKRTLSSVSSFIALFRLKAIGVDHLQRVFTDHLELLLNNVFCIFGGQYDTPRNAIEPVIDMLFLVTDAPEAKEPLQKIVDSENFPTCYATRDQKARLISRLMQERNRPKYKAACNEFVLVVRNLNRMT